MKKETHILINQDCKHCDGTGKKNLIVMDIGKFDVGSTVEIYQIIGDGEELRKYGVIEGEHIVVLNHDTPGFTMFNHNNTIIRYENDQIKGHLV